MLQRTRSMPSTPRMPETVRLRSQSSYRSKRNQSNWTPRYGSQNSSKRHALESSNVYLWSVADWLEEGITENSTTGQRCELAQRRHINIARREHEQIDAHSRLQRETDGCQVPRNSKCVRATKRFVYTYLRACVCEFGVVLVLRDVECFLLRGAKG